MKKKNIRVGMNVQIKDGAWLVLNDQVDDVLTVDKIDASGVWCSKAEEKTKGMHYYGFKEVRKVKGHAYL